MKQENKIVIALAAGVLLAGGIILGNWIWGKIDKAPIRPIVCDRTGKPLLTDRRKDLFSPPVRHAEYNGKFAAALLGHTFEKNGKRLGAAGIESVIDRNGIKQAKLLLRLDVGIQEKCEALLDSICDYSNPRYTYVTVIDSDGALIAAAQRPVIDLNNRAKVDRFEMVFMASTYTFTVPDAWMRLLGSRSDAGPKEKMELHFHRKLGIFSGEGQGDIPGSNKPLRNRNDTQTATALNFLLACAGRMENKEIPSLQLFAPRGEALSVLKLANDFQWCSLLWSKTRSTLSGLGTVSTGNGKKLYVLLRVVLGHIYPVPMTNGKKYLPEEYCTLLEKVIRTFPGNGPLSAEDDAYLREMKVGLFSRELELSTEEKLKQRINGIHPSIEEKNDDE